MPGTSGSYYRLTAKVLLEAIDSWNEYVGKTLAERYVTELDCMFKFSFRLFSVYVYPTLHFLSLCLEILVGFGVKRNSKSILFLTAYVIHRRAQFR